eukprot:GHVR01020947.1.p1 GENE.GHVR01020947.1~~GHVR01020947.1.p1  ORF type:complete len:515 (-),score=103.34 GHVR01020947.1:5-1549(-)
MVQFGRTIDDCRTVEWNTYYVDYNELKQHIKAVSKSVENLEDKEIVVGLVKNFGAKIDVEIDRSSSFFSEEMQRCITTFIQLKPKVLSVTPADIVETYHECKSLTKRMTSLLNFVELNAEAIRKILKKVDKQVSKSTGYAAFPEAGGFLTHFIKSRLRPDRISSLEQLQVLELPRVQLIYVEIHNMVAQLQENEVEWLSTGTLTKECAKMMHIQGDTLMTVGGVEDTSASAAGGGSSAAGGGSSAAGGGSGGKIVKRRTVMVVREDTVELLDDFAVAAKRAVETTSFYRWLGGEALVDYEKEPVGDCDMWGLTMNNYNTFLYMVNYYIAIPTSGLYFTTLGISDFWNGALLAMSPLASTLASVLYSKWSNKSFKEPMLFSSGVLVVGNLVYALAYDFRSPLMLFMARLIVGFGGVRAVNRRYIADFTTIETRTFHSAIFVAVGSLGMTVGPGSQMLLDYCNFKIPFINATCNNLTAPGWIMVPLWIIFFILVSLLFLFFYYFFVYGFFFNIIIL